MKSDLSRGDQFDLSTTQTHTGLLGNESFQRHKPLCLHDYAMYCIVLVPAFRKKGITPQHNVRIYTAVKIRRAC